MARRYQCAKVDAVVVCGISLAQAPVRTVGYRPKLWDTNRPLDVCTAMWMILCGLWKRYLAASGRHSVLEDALRAEITREFTFEAAHHLPCLGPEHKCSRLHGHLFRVEVTVGGEVDPVFGWIMDFGDLARVGREVVGQLDHQVLNEVPGLEVPTSENIARFVFERIASRIPGVVAVTVHESPDSRCTFRPGEGRPTGTVVVASGPGLAFSAAHLLLFPPDGREPLHGHDYRLSLEAVLSAPGDTSMAAQVLLRAGQAVVQDLDHHVLLPEIPIIGRLARDENSVSLDVAGQIISLPAGDCVLLPISNTTTEALAGYIAGRVAANEAVTGRGMSRIRARLCEGSDSVAVAGHD